MENALAHGIIGWSFSVLDADYWPNVRYQEVVRKNRTLG